MSLIIRYLPRDPYTVRLVAQWLYCEWGYSLPGNSVEWAVERFSHRAESHHLPTCLVAYQDGEPVGTASLVTLDIPGLQHLTPWLGAVYVRPDCRSNGIGKALIRRMPEEWRKLGYPTAYLYTPDCVDFYRRMGWGVLQWHKYLGERVAIMRWEGNVEVPTSKSLEIPSWKGVTTGGTGVVSANYSAASPSNVPAKTKALF
jgi:predicted N-acetyltransferase YhbS